MDFKIELWIMDRKILHYLGEKKTHTHTHIDMLNNHINYTLIHKFASI